MTDVFVVMVLLTSSPVVNATRYDLTMPLEMEGGSQLIAIDVELRLLAVTFSGALGAKVCKININLALMSTQHIYL